MDKGKATVWLDVVERLLDDLIPDSLTCLGACCALIRWVAYDDVELH
jgi:hypothetical protein